jgi:hypothetical protein
MVEFGPMFYIIAAFVLLVFFVLFLFVRRTLQGFKQGLQDSSKK